VTPDGVAFKSGAKVVKSVAGYDLHRLLCGAWGTLAVITEITLKVQPTPQHFEAVGWQTTWDALEPTLAELMQMPLQPDGISVLAFRGGNLNKRAVWSAEAQLPPIAEASLQHSKRAVWSAEAQLPPIAEASLQHSRAISVCYMGNAVHASATVLTPPPTLAPLTLPEPQTEPRMQTEQAAPTPYVLLEFSGAPEGVAWQIAQLRERGYPAEPVPDAMLQQVRDWLAPRQHALLLQILLRPSEIADAMARWSELRGVSVLAHAGNGVLYVAADESGLTDALLQRVRALTAKYRVLSGAGWLREQSGGELPKLALSDGERRLMQRLKAALDERGILPDLISR